MMEIICHTEPVPLPICQMYPVNQEVRVARGEAAIFSFTTPFIPHIGIRGIREGGHGFIRMDRRGLGLWRWKENREWCPFVDHPASLEQRAWGSAVASCRTYHCWGYHNNLSISSLLCRPSYLLLCYKNRCFAGLLGNKWLIQISCSWLIKWHLKSKIRWVFASLFIFYNSLLIFKWRLLWRCARVQSCLIPSWKRSLFLESPTTCCMPSWTRLMLACSWARRCDILIVRGREEAKRERGRGVGEGRGYLLFDTHPNTTQRMWRPTWISCVHLFCFAKTTSLVWRAFCCKPAPYLSTLPCRYPPLHPLFPSLSLKTVVCNFLFISYAPLLSTPTPFRTSLHTNGL